MNLLSLLEPLITPFVIAFACFALIGVVGLFLSRNNPDQEEGKQKKPFTYRHKQFFMTRAENGFYQGLVKAVGDRYAIFAQVHLPDIVDEKVPGQDWRAARSRINRKSIDFVLCDREYLNPKLAIELDDASHEREERQARDVFVEEVLRMAELPLLRVHYAENIDVEELRKRIGAVIPFRN